MSMRRSSTPLPPRPMMIPGFAAKTVTLTLFAARSISMRDTPAAFRVFFTCLRIFAVLEEQRGEFLGRHTTCSPSHE